jgi:hypothetical protein
MPRRSTFLLLAGLMTCAAIARATTLVPLDTRALALQSQEIVVGTVESSHSYWNEAHSRIFTDVVLKVDRRLKGAGTERVTITQMGGVVDGVRVRVHATPDFKVGEEALIFAAKDGRGRLQLNGLAQGKFEIEHQGSERLVQRRTPGFAFKDVRTLKAVPAGEAPARVTLDAMIAEVQSILDAEAGR